jgi:hypothetical protein
MMIGSARVSRTLAVSCIVIDVSLVYNFVVSLPLVHCCWCVTDVCWCRGSIAEKIFTPLVDKIKANGAEVGLGLNVFNAVAFLSADALVTYSIGRLTWARCCLGHGSILS